MAAGETDSAIQFYQRAASLAPKDPVPLVRLATAYAKAGAPAAAYDAYGQARARDPQAENVELAMGRLALRLDKPQEAISHFEAARRRHDEATVWNGLGVAHDALGDHATAQSNYRKGLEAKPDDILLRNNLGLSQALSGDYPGAIATLSSLASDPQAGPGNRLTLAMVYGLAGDEEKARQIARRDLGEADVAANLQYYRVLKAMDDRSRTRAILGLGVGTSTPISAAPAK